MTVLVALIGNPVEHSRSPAMHNTAFEELGLDWRYEAIAVEPERFEATVGELPARGFVGANITIPHKLRALELADSVGSVARAVGAANTLTFTEQGTAADNTDVQGFLQALRERVPEAPRGMSALVLGAGGAARAVVYALTSEGAASVRVWNRHPERARELVAHLGSHAGKAALEAVGEPGVAEADLVVNATAVGMARIPDRDAAGGGRTGEADFKDLCFSADELSDRQVLVDLVYRDDDTDLVRAACARGLRCVDGLDVLVHQGAASFELWTGKQAPLEAMRHGATERQR